MFGVSRAASALRRLLGAVVGRIDEAVRPACLGCRQEFPAIEMWVSKRFEGKAYCDACYYQRYGPRKRPSTGKG